MVFSSGPGGQGAYNYAGALVEPCAGGDTNCMSSTTNNFTFTEEFRTGSLLGGTTSAVGYSDDFYGMQRQFTTSSCGVNEIAIGIDAEGDPICSPFPSQTCGPGETVTSVTGNAVTCSPLPSFTCPNGQSLLSISSGSAVCGSPAGTIVGRFVDEPRLNGAGDHNGWRHLTHTGHIASCRAQVPLGQPTCTCGAGSFRQMTGRGAGLNAQAKRFYLCVAGYSLPGTTALTGDSDE